MFLRKFCLFVPETLMVAKSVTLAASVIHVILKHCMLSFPFIFLSILPPPLAL